MHTQDQNHHTRKSYEHSLFCKEFNTNRKSVFQMIIIHGNPIHTGPDSQVIGKCRWQSESRGLENAGNEHALNFKKIRGT